MIATLQAGFLSIVTSILLAMGLSLPAQAQNVEEDCYYDDSCYEEFDPYYYGEYDEDLNGDLRYLNYGIWADNSDNFMRDGIRAGVDSETEKWYSSKVLYHYRTSEWSTDDEGYYRDDDGYYVVSSDDYAEGEVINTSKGEAKVYDSGAGSGNTDFYVSW